jgi:HEAT repeat protein
VWRIVLFAVVATLALPAEPARAQGDAARVAVLLRALKGPDFDTASAAAAELRALSAERPAVVAGLVDALKTGEWKRCAGDMRDTIARELGELKAREAVVPLLELVRSGKSIEHECAE